MMRAGRSSGAQSKYELRLHRIEFAGRENGLKSFRLLGEKYFLMRTEGSTLIHNGIEMTVILE
jgi:hypothetical protein